MVCLTWGLASSAPTSSTQSACEMQMRDQGVTAASASRMMNLQRRLILLIDYIYRVYIKYLSYHQVSDPATDHIACSLGSAGS